MNVANNAIPVWDGDPDHIPLRDVRFFYNGRVYHWKPCDCGTEGCDRPTAHNADGTANRSMTIRIRGEDSGSYQIAVLLKCGKTIDQIANEYDSGTSINDQFYVATEGLDSAEIMDRFLRYNDITPREMKLAIYEWLDLTQELIDETLSGILTLEAITNMFHDRKNDHNYRLN